MTNGALTIDNSIDNSWVNNPLTSRCDLLDAVAALLAPLLPKYLPKKSVVHLLATGTHFDVINEVNIVNNNWLFFRVLVNIGLRTVGEKYSDEVVHSH
ncbi:hypothetical protein V1508DRAFT_400914 [Lipomyces doorenjongii]|uniref:uncharacterized protein n=1 Tax=Lipomyces doorenjongii TaxID=383834 RepID=UPI0034CF343D